MGRKYRNPSVIEALCEFQFVPGQKWDLTVPGLIYDKVKGKFPIKQQQIGIGVQFRTTEKGLEHKVEPAPPRMQFYNKDKTALIQIAPDLLVINQLKPYPTWAKFKPMVLEALETYKKEANPKGFKRIGLRYINKINIKAASVQIEDYVGFYPTIPEDLPQFHTGFISRVEIPYKENRDRMLITISSAPPEDPNTTLIILDIDYVMAIPEAIPMAACEEWIEQAHSILEKAFESCITDKSRDLFEEVK